MAIRLAQGPKPRESSEGIFYVEDLASAARLQYAYHVEPRILKARRPLRQIHLSQAPNLRLLARGYGLQRVAEPRAPAQLHLDEHQDLCSRVQSNLLARR